MGKYQKYDLREMSETKWRIHPVWRGIGCILLILLPVISYAAGALLVEANRENNWFVLPWQLTGPPQYPYLFANLFAMVIFIVVGFALLSTLYAFLYRIVGPPKYGPMDAPPAKKVRSRRR